MIGNLNAMLMASLWRDSAARYRVEIASVDLTMGGCTQLRSRSDSCIANLIWSALDIMRGNRKPAWSSIQALPVMAALRLKDADR